MSVQILSGIQLILIPALMAYLHVSLLSSFNVHSSLLLYVMLYNSKDIGVAVIVKATNGPRYVVGCRRQLDKSKLKAGTRVALDMTTLTIMRSVSYCFIITLL